MERGAVVFHGGGKEISSAASALGSRYSILRGNYCCAGKYNTKAALECAHALPIYFFILIREASSQASCRGFFFTLPNMSQCDVDAAVELKTQRPLVTRQV